MENKNKNQGPKQPKPKYAGSIRKYCRANAITEWYFLCGCGRKGVNFYDYRPCIQCDVCKLWKHVKCVGFPEDVFKLANEMRKRRVWVCSDCKSGNFHFIAKIWDKKEETTQQQISSSTSPLDETTKTIEENEEYEKKLAERKNDRRKMLKRMPTAFDSEYAKVEEIDMDKILAENYESPNSPRSPKKHVYKSPPPEVTSKSGRRRKSAADNGVKEVPHIQKAHSECIPLANSLDEKKKEKKEKKKNSSEISVRIEKESKKKEKKSEKEVKNEEEIVNSTNNSKKRNSSSGKNKNRDSNNSNSSKDDDSFKIDSDNSSRDEIKIEVKEEDENNLNNSNNNVENIESISIVVSLHEENNEKNNDDKEKHRIKFDNVIVKITEENSSQQPRSTSDEYPKKSILKSPTPQFLEPTPPPLHDYLNDPGNVIFQESPKDRLVRAGRTFIRSLSVY